MQYPVLYRPIEQNELSDLLKTTILTCYDSFNKGTYPDVLSILIKTITTAYTPHCIAEFGRNVLLAVEQGRNGDADCDLFAAVLSEDIGVHALISRSMMVPELVQSLNTQFGSTTSVCMCACARACVCVCVLVCMHACTYALYVCLCAC